MSASPPSTLPSIPSCTSPAPPSTGSGEPSIGSNPTWSTSPPRPSSAGPRSRHARRRSIPVVSSFHTHFDQYADHYRVAWTKAAVDRYLRWFHNATRETYVPSNAAIRNLQSRGYERLVLWPRGVDGTLFRPDRPGRDRVRREHGLTPQDVVIGHVSRIAAEKNVEYLGQALAQVIAHRPQARPLIVGDGPERPRLEQQLGPHARFAGYRTGDDLADHYAAADLFVFASRTETFGNVILEAMATGLPVVAIAEGGPAEIVDDGCTGLLVPGDAPPGDHGRPHHRADRPSRPSPGSRPRGPPLCSDPDLGGHHEPPPRALQPRMLLGHNVIGLSLRVRLVRGLSPYANHGQIIARRSRPDELADRLHHRVPRPLRGLAG